MIPANRNALDEWVAGLTRKTKKTMLFNEPYAVSVVKFLKTTDDPF
jgi:hypothetical protein